MFVVFEGIDGSGKTTLSGRVSELLEEAGLTTHHARPKGELKSRLAKNIRTMARDPRSLTMSPHTELLMYLARDCQMIDTVIRPALDKARVVIADRYVYSPVILCRARGLVPREDIDTAVEVVARGLWPDLVVYCDVDIHTSNLRKKMDKTVSPRDPEDFGRKGLRGLGLRAAMRDEYLSMAEDEGSWMKVDNVNGSIEENSAAIAHRILEMVGAGGEFKKRPSTANPAMTPVADVENAQEVKTVFYNYLEKLESAGYNRLASYHARSLDSKEAWLLRERNLEKEPEVVARGLEPLGSEQAVAMRRQLISAAPRQVARSLGARWADDHPDAMALREELADDVPIDVAMTLGALDTEHAWTMREKLAVHKKAKGAVLASVRKLDTERAWSLRKSLGKKKLDWALLESLAGIDSEQAWELRRKHIKNAAPWVILSLAGLDSKEAFELRERFFLQATKLVIRSLSGLECDQAWKMREGAGKWCKESLTTIKGSNHERAWSLREALSDTWPQFAAKSIGMTLGTTEKGLEFVKSVARAHPDNPEVMHYLVKLNGAVS